MAANVGPPVKANSSLKSLFQVTLHGDEKIGEKKGKSGKGKE